MERVGLFEPPHDVVEPVQNICSKVFWGHIWGAARRETSQYEALIEEASQYVDRPNYIERDESVLEIQEIDISDWCYLEGGEADIVGPTVSDEYVEVKRGRLSGGAKGGYNTLTHLLKITFRDPPELSIGEIQDIHQEMLQTARHESMHLGQTALQGALDLDSLAGVPPKSAQTACDYYDDDRPDHDQLDCEFYPLLRDEIEAIREALNGIETPDRRWAVAEAWVGREPHMDVDETTQAFLEEVQKENDSPFGTWRRTNPDKYKVGVKKFFKALRRQDILPQETTP
jgi:hypothetical protein